MQLVWLPTAQLTCWTLLCVRLCVYSFDSPKKLHTWETSWWWQKEMRWNKTRASVVFWLKDLWADGFTVKVRGEVHSKSFRGSWFDDGDANGSWNPIMKFLSSVSKCIYHDAQSDLQISGLPQTTEMFWTLTLMATTCHVTFPIALFGHYLEQIFS